jgi:TP901-1 family phage major tail protein
VSKGPAFLLKISNAAEPEVFSTVAGLRATAVCINGDVVAVSAKDAGAWRELLAGAGTRMVSVAATGIFLGGEAEATVRSRALAGSVDDCQLVFETGEKLHGKFLVARLDYAGDFNGERNYTLRLESSGPVVQV